MVRSLLIAVWGSDHGKVTAHCWHQPVRKECCFGKRAPNLETSKTARHTLTHQLHTGTSLCKFHLYVIWRWTQQFRHCSCSDRIVTVGYGVQEIGKGVRRSGGGLAHVTFRYGPTITEKNHVKHQSGQLVSEPSFTPGTCSIWSSSKCNWMDHTVLNCADSPLTFNRLIGERPTARICKSNAKNCKPAHDRLWQQRAPLTVCTSVLPRTATHRPRLSASVRHYKLWLPARSFETYAVHSAIQRHMLDDLNPHVRTQVRISTYTFYYTKDYYVTGLWVTEFRDPQGWIASAQMSGELRSTYIGHQTDSYVVRQ